MKYNLIEKITPKNNDYEMFNDNIDYTNSKVVLQNINELFNNDQKIIELADKYQKSIIVAPEIQSKAIFGKQIKINYTSDKPHKIYIPEGTITTIGTLHDIKKNKIEFFIEDYNPHIFSDVKKQTKFEIEILNRYGTYPDSNKITITNAKSDSNICEYFEVDDVVCNNILTPLLNRNLTINCTNSEMEFNASEYAKIAHPNTGKIVKQKNGIYDLSETLIAINQKTPKSEIKKKPWIKEVSSFRSYCAGTLYTISAGCMINGSLFYSNDLNSYQNCLNAAAIVGTLGILIQIPNAIREYKHRTHDKSIDDFNENINLGLVGIINKEK